MKTRQERLSDGHFSHWTLPGITQFELVHTIEARDHSNSQSPRAKTPDIRVTSSFIPPVTAAQCWANTDTEEVGVSDGGQCLARRYSCVSVLASGLETPRQSFMRCSRGAVKHLFTDVNSPHLGFMH